MSAGTSADIAPAPDVVGRLGVRLHPRGTGADAGVLLRLGLRRNPRRAQLLVSTVLGKHIPTDPRLVRAAGLLLGGLVGDVLAGHPRRELPVALLHAAVRAEPGAAQALHAAATPPGDPHDVLVLGFAETATALGHCVAEGLGGTDYLHSTRRPVAGVAQAGGFSEEHSHATEHFLLPADPALLRGDRPLVLVDDELSTGRTALNTITALHRAAPRERYVVAALVDVRDEDAHALQAGVEALGARLDVVSLAQAAVELPDDVVERAAAIREELDRDAAAGAAQAAPDVAEVRLEALGWPAGLPVGGRHGFLPAHHRTLDDVLPALVTRLAAATGLRPGERVLVLGTEELMALPLRLAQVLAGAGPSVAFSTTTRSPAVVVAAEGYALTSGITFPAHDDPADGPGPRFAYNLGGRHTWDHVLVVVDPPALTPALASGLLAALAPLTRRTTVVVTP
ncbi:phosphoribosyltransferase family protein [Pseudonocardia sp. TRM90224]|uniref:phosphoribosyltransferase family protein n=1 Tax=Pseudonocardia sp. TRM90224 TaxID=2812678 RepID=UPI001E3D9BD8|nr:phosphoribosyltransferase family protein [Pseudonocardia sp. TRM90224]